jgi:hypothetical protein
MRLDIGERRLLRVTASGVQQCLLSLAIWRGETGTLAILSHRRTRELHSSEIVGTKQSGSASLTTAEAVRTGIERM